MGYYNYSCKHKSSNLGPTCNIPFITHTHISTQNTHGMLLLLHRLNTDFLFQKLIFSERRQKDF